MALGLHIQGVDHLGIDDIHLVQLTADKQLRHLLRNIPCPVHIRVLGRVLKVYVDGNVLGLKIPAAHFAHHKEFVMVLVLSGVSGLLGDLDHIVVVGTGHALVGGDHNIAFFSILRRQIGPLVKKRLPASGDSIRILAKASCIVKKYGSVFFRSVLAFESLEDEIIYMALVIFMVSLMLFIRLWISLALAMVYLLIFIGCGQDPPAVRR